jgi:hypothetical protein
MYTRGTLRKNKIVKVEETKMYLSNPLFYLFTFFEQTSREKKLHVQKIVENDTRKLSFLSSFIS